MYKAMEVRQKERQAKMRDAASHTSVQEKVQQVCTISTREYIYQDFHEMLFI